MADWNSILEEKLAEAMNGISGQVKEYEDARASEQAALDRQKADQEAQYKKNLEQALQQAYVSRRMAEKNMPQLLAAQGISGGMTETTAGNIYNDYLNTQNAANSSYDDSLRDLNGKYTTNTASLKSKYAQMIAAANQKANEQALSLAQFAYQAKIAEEEKARQEEERRRQEEEQRRLEEERAAAAARSSRGYSGRGNGNDDDDPGEAPVMPSIKYNTSYSGMGTQKNKKNPAGSSFNYTYSKKFGAGGAGGGSW